MRRIACCTGLGLAGGLLILLSAWPSFAQNTCDATLDLTNPDPPEAELRTQVAEALTCQWATPQRDYRAIAALTDDYINRSSSPACQILLINARAKLELARSLEERGELTRSELDEVVLQRGRAWDILTGISAAWENSADAGLDRAQHDEAFERCVLPARSDLRQYPSVTITMEPETISGYSIYWDRVHRTGSLPRILPGEHVFEVHPPPGYRTTIRRSNASGEETVLACDQVGKISRWLKIDWMERAQFTVSFLSADEPSDVCTPICADPPCLSDLELSLDQTEGGMGTLFWAGLATAVVGSAGITGSLLHARALDEEGTDLFISQGCASRAPTCEQGRILDNYDSADAWRLWGPIGFGAVASAGVAAVVYSLLDDDETSEKTSGDSGALLTPLLGKNHTGFSVSGKF